MLTLIASCVFPALGTPPAVTDHFLWLTDTRLGMNLVLAFVSLSQLPHCQQDLDQDHLPQLELEHPRGSVDCF